MSYMKQCSSLRNHEAVFLSDNVSVLDPLIEEIFTQTQNGDLDEEEFVLDNAKSIIANSRNQIEAARNLGLKVYNIKRNKGIRKNIEKHYDLNSRPWMKGVEDGWIKHGDKIEHYTNHMKHWTRLSAEQRKDKDKCLRSINWYYSNQGVMNKSFFGASMIAKFHKDCQMFVQSKDVSAIQYGFDQQKGFVIFCFGRGDDPRTVDNSWYNFVELLKDGMC
eukprot:147402_1